MPTHIFMILNEGFGALGPQAARARRCQRGDALPNSLLQRHKAQPVALRRGAGVPVGISQLSGIAPVKRHVSQYPALQGDWAELGQVTPGTPHGQGAAAAGPEAPLETPVCACSAFLSLFYFFFLM